MLQSVMVPKLNRMAIRKLNNRYSWMLRFGSTLVEHNHLGSTDSARPAVVTMDSLLNKSSKSRDDIDTIVKLLPRTADKELQREALLLLLQYHRYEAVLHLLETKSRDAHEDSLLWQALVLSSDYEALKSYASQLDFKTRRQALSRSVHSLLSLKRVKGSLLLWLIVSDIDFKSLHLLHTRNSSQHMAVLYGIISAVDDIGQICSLASQFLPKDQHENFYKTVSFAVYRLEQFDKSVRLWKVTPDEYKTSTQLVHTIKALSYTQMYGKAMLLYKDNEPLHTPRVQRAMIPIVTGLDYRDEAFAITEQLFKDGIMTPYKSLRVLETLLKDKRFEEFDILSEDYATYYKKPTPMFYNVLMKRELVKKDAPKFFEHVNKIYSSGLKPSGKTFTLLLEQMAKKGSITTAMSLFDMLSRREKGLNIQHATLILKAMKNADDIDTLPKVLSTMRKLQIEPNDKFRYALMELHYRFNNYSEVQKLFYEESNHNPDQKMHLLLMKTYLRLGDLTAAKATLEATKKLFKSPPKVLYSELEYYCSEGDFNSALKVLNDMNTRGYKITNKHYATLMHGYNSHKQFENTLTVFNMISRNRVILSSYTYHELLVALIRLDIINNKNLQRPTQVVDNLMEALRQKKLPIDQKLHFKAIKPLVSAFLKHYRPAEANRLMQNFKVLRPDFDVDYNLNFMKEELKLYALEKDWKSFEIVLHNFQQRVKNTMNETASAPKHMKKIYNSVIKSIYCYYSHVGDIKRFYLLFKDLIFVNNFTFDSKHLNWVVRRFIRQEQTLHYGLYLIEKKLIGGEISRRILRSINKRKAEQNLLLLVASSKGPYKRPYLRTGYLYRQELVNMLYAYIINTRLGSKRSGRDKLDGWSDPYLFLRKKYPKLIKNLPELRSKLSGGHKRR